MKIFPITRERYWAYLKWIITARGWFQQFTPFSHNRRDTDCCVIGNGIPKSGTYFMNKIIEYLGKWEDLHIHITSKHWNLRPESSDVLMNRCLSKFAIKKLQNGQFIAAHLPWNQDVERIIRDIMPTRRIKHIFIYRDLRDTFISYTNFVTNSKKNLNNPASREEQRFMKENFSNDDDRLVHVIKHRSSSSYLSYYLEYIPWLDSPSCHAVRFEDLYQDVLNTCNGRFGKVLRDLFNYLEIDPNSINPVDFYNNVYNKGRTASKEVNKIGQFKRVFKNQHYALLDNPEFKNVLRAFGYKEV